MNEQPRTFKSEVLQELAWRGFIYQLTHDELDEELSQGPMTLYCGFDPTASSLHVGNLVAIMGLAHFYRHGHRPMALVGGATGLIGDPSGRSTERNLMDEETLQGNVKCIGGQLNTVLQTARALHVDQAPEDGEAVELVNNADWLKEWSFIDFLRDVGRHFRVNQMLAKDSVRARLEEREQGISYTEFSYMLIQSYDFLHLFKTRGCRLQLGGSDQWGNITSGVDLTRRRTGESTFGLTFPLITSADGKKIGKSLGGAVYLDGEMTSSYAFYQYWINQADADCGRFLRLFTFLPRAEIEALEQKVAAGENRGEVQQVLAREVTSLIHGPEECEKVIRASRMLFGEKIEGLNDRDLGSIFAEVPSTDVARERLEGGELGLLDLLVNTGLQKSKGQARRLLEQGGVYINNERVEDPGHVLSTGDLASESMLVLRAGKKRYHVVRCV
ncbi:tyrosine--tRNA ligase [Lujinxingia litoralis]|uniref:Tyrosine--tRNA ligase n=1 Tax=Lujinxingia litoralis TaxID=2211119 RepID=A0A328C1Q1_9DELT|nr:tyrosine--tRNA ligase [Lujinxingia litoralis]RAL20549.1 tyrosine--tRNA ligase [Lujinxingia litoralis]